MSRPQPTNISSRPSAAAVFCETARLLNDVTTVRQVAETLRDAADRLFQWDSLIVDVYLPEADAVSNVLLIDRIDGSRREVAKSDSDTTPTPMFREVAENGAKLILREKADSLDVSLTAFGDKSKPSASLMFVPIRTCKRVLGMLSIQSYTADAYNNDDVATLQYLADLSCGALMRLDVEKKYRSSFENALRGRVRITLQGQVLAANNSFAVLLGFSTPAQLLKQVSNIGQLFRQQPVYRDFEKLLGNKDVIKDFEAELYRQTGVVLWISISGHTENGEDGVPLYFEAAIEDISKRKTAEAALRRTEELYRRAIRAAGAVSYGVDYKTKTYSFIDDNIEQLIGYAAHEMVPSIWKDIVKKRVMLGDVANLSCEEAAARVVTGELQRWGCDMLVTTRDGKIRWISDVSVQNMGPDGKPTGSVGVLLDVTERKEAELNALAFAKMHHGLSLAPTAEAAAEIIGEVAQDLFGWDAYWVKIHDAEQKVLHRTLSIDTIDGRKVRDDDAHSHPLSELHWRVLNEGGQLILRDQPNQALPGAVPFGDKARPSASLMIVPIRYGDKNVGIMSVQSYTRNAYARRQIQAFQVLADQCAGALERIWTDEAFRKSESRFRLVWDSSVDGMRLTDEQGTVLMVNDAYCKMVGKTKPELEGQPFTVIYGKDGAAAGLERHNECFRARTTDFRLEEQVLLWNGAEVWFETSNSLLEWPNQPRLLLTIVRDVTERKNAAVALEALNKQFIAASRKAGMAEVASGVLHNVGNVLNSVNVAANLVAERLRNSRQTNLASIAQLLEDHSADLVNFFATDARARQLPSYIRTLSNYLVEEQVLTLKELETVRKNVDHIKDIVAMQQSYAKVSGLIQAQPVVELVEDALQMNAAALARHDVIAIKDYQANPTITTDKHKVLQILVNFIRNAKYACDEGHKAEKRITVTIRAKDAGWVQIIASDNGVGILPENLTRIFSHGFTTREAGHGFGLHSSALAAKELGGFIFAHSDGPGTGASFTLELPLQYPTQTKL